MKPEFGCSGPQSPLTARRAAEIDMRLPTTRATQTALTAPEGKSLRTRIMPQWQERPLRIRLFKG
jgi:hypothetical protein